MIKKCPYCGMPVTPQRRRKQDPRGKFIRDENGKVIWEVTQSVIFHKNSCRPANTKAANGKYEIENEFPDLNHGGWL
jgi:hypothetical protein